MIIQHTSTESSEIPLAAQPPLALDLFIRQSGLSPATCWRYRKRGWLKTVLIAGRHYITRGSIAQFNERAARGDFAGTIQNPSTNRSVNARGGTKK